MRRPQDAKENYAISCSPSTQARSGSAGRPMTRLRPGARRQSSAKERGARAAGGKKLDGLEHSVHAVLATTTRLHHHHHHSRRHAYSAPPFEIFGESSY
jgi:hypothetical protein